MKTLKRRSLLGCSLLAVILSAGSAQAWHVTGKVVCDENGNHQIDTEDHAISGVMVAVENASGTFSTVVNTSADGTFLLALPNVADSYLAYIHPPTVPPGATILLPTGGVFAFALTNEQQFFEHADFLLDCIPEEGPPVAGSECGKVTGGGWIV